MKFISGEISPTTIADTGSELYQTGLETAEGFICCLDGCTMCPGTYYAENTKSDVKVRNYPFVYSQDDTYTLEFGPLYIRFYRNNAKVGAPYEVTTTYTADELRELSFEQDADTLFIDHNNHQRAKLVRTDHDDWMLSDLDMENGPFLTRNTSSITVTPSATTGSIDLVASDDVFTSGNVNGLYKIEHDLEEQKVEDEFTVAPTATDSVYIQKGEVLQINVPETYTGTIEVQFSDDDSDWEIYSTYVSANDNPISINLVAPQDQYTRLYCSVLTSGSPDYFLGAQSYRHRGVVRIDTVTDAQNATATVLTQLGAAIATILWSEGSWSTRRGFPATVFRENNRLCHAASKYEPNKIWESETNTIDKHRAGDLATDAFQQTMPGIADPIRWVTEEDGGIKVGTLKEIALYKPADQSQGARLLNPHKLHRKIAFPCSYIPPIPTGFSELIISNGGKMIGELQYAEREKILYWDDKTKFRKHILHVDDGEGIVDAAWTSRPYPILWCVRSDGELIPFVFDKISGLNAFSKAHYVGSIETVCSIPKSTYDQLWVAGLYGSERYQCYMDELDIYKPLEDMHFYEAGLSYEGGSANITGISKASECVVSLDVWPADGTGTDMVDGDNIYIQNVSGMTEINQQIYTVSDADSTAKTLKLKDSTGTNYINTTTYSTYASGGTLEERDNTFTGLPFPDGTEVYCKVGVLEDTVLNMHVVTATCTSGSITLDDYYRYVSTGQYQERTLQPMPLEGRGSAGKLKAINALNVFAYRTLGGRIAFVNRQGQDCKEKQLDWSKLRDPSSTIENTGLVRIDTSSGQQSRIRYKIKETEGLPMTILDIQPEV